MGRHRLAHDEPAVVARLAAARVPADLLPPPPRDRLKRPAPDPARATRPPRILRCACHCIPARASRSSRCRTTRCCSALRRRSTRIADIARRRRRGVPLPARRRAARVARAARRPRDRRRPAAGAAAPDRAGRCAAGRPRRGARRAVARRDRPRERDHPRRRRASRGAPGRRELETLLRPDRATRLPWRDRRPRLRGGRPAARSSQAGARRASIPHSSRPTSSSRSAPARRVLHGGATALVDASVPGTMRAARTVSLLEANGRAGLQTRRPRSRRSSARAVPIVGLSLVLDRPRTTGLYRGYPWRPRRGRRGRPLPVPAAAERLTRGAAPPPARRRARASSTSSPRSPGRPRSRTRRRWSAAPRCAASSSTSRSTRSSCRSPGKGRTCPASP